MLLRLKMPPAINQFTQTLDKNQASATLRLLKKYIPETKEAKKQRLLEMAQQKKDGKEVTSKKPVVVKFGLNHVTTLVEEKHAKLVVIAHDVDPIELVCWLPALCRKKDVPYCILKGKGRLGKLVHKKFASCVALTSIRQEDQNEVSKLASTFMNQFNDNAETKKKGDGIMGIKSQHIMQRREKAIRLEQEKKMGHNLA